MKLSRKEIYTLWQALECAIDLVKFANPQTPLHDYSIARDYAKLNALLRAEIAHERRHRTMYKGNAYPIPATHAAELVVLRNIYTGATRCSAPLATIFLELRDTAAEAQTIGYEIREHIGLVWLTKVDNGTRRI